MTTADALSRRSDGPLDDPYDGLHQQLARTEAATIREFLGKIDAQKNRKFKQMYAKGWQRIRRLTADHGSTVPLRLWAYLAEVADVNNIVVAAARTLAEELGVSVKTIRRAADVLEKDGALVRLRVGEGGAYAYCLDPAEVWAGFADGKAVAPFNTRTLIRRRDNEPTIRSLRTVIPADAS